MNGINNLNQNISFGKSIKKSNDSHKKTDLKTQAMNITKNPTVQIGAGAIATVATGAAVIKFHKPTNTFVNEKIIAGLKPKLSEGLEKLNEFKNQVTNKLGNLFKTAKTEVKAEANNGFVNNYQI